MEAIVAVLLVIGVACYYLGKGIVWISYIGWIILLPIRFVWFILKTIFKIVWFVISIPFKLFIKKQPQE